MVSVSDRTGGTQMSVRKLVGVLIALVLVAAACTSDGSNESTTTIPDETTTTSGSGGGGSGSVQPLTPDEFSGFVNDIGWKMIRRNPEDVTDLGLDALISEPIDDLADLSPGFRRGTLQMAEDALARLDTLDVSQLDPDDAVTETVLRWYLEDIVAMAPFQDHESPVSFITGAHTNFPEFMADVHPVDSSANAEAYVARLNAAGKQMEQVAENIGRADRLGLSPTRTGVNIAQWQLNNVINGGNPHPLVSDFESRLDLVESIGPGEHDRLVDQAGTAVRSSLLTGYRTLLNALNGIDVRSDADPGAWQLPDGTDYYAAILQHHLTLDMSPDDVHQLGLDNVERLRTEVSDALSVMGYDVADLGFAGAVIAARADGGTFTLGTEENRNAVLTETEAHIAAGTEAFSSMFTALPAAELQVQRPRAGREGDTGAWYRPPPAYGDRPGIYYLNLGGQEKEAQTWATTNYHEAIPGHHFQLAIQRESAHLPLIQRASVFTGYAEGWGLYAERLAFEAGLYEDDPQGNIGRLRMELLRASRVVVDTGIHHLGWTYDEALQYMLGLGFEEAMSASEIDRYVVWPGQAPAYLVGMLEILRVRQKAIDALGDDFDIATFHDEILRHGSLPLAALEPIIDEFIAQGG